MLKQSPCALGILATLMACGDGPAKKTPRLREDIPAYAPISAQAANAAAVTPNSSSATTLSGSATAPGASAASGSLFTLTSVKSTVWESNCYRFSTTGDYSKKYWAFTADSMTSLLLKYADAACTVLAKNVDGSAKVWSTWVVGTLAAAPLVDSWALVTGSCSKGCTGEYKSAFRATSDILNEGSKIAAAVPESYNIGDGKYVSFSKLKTAIDLEALAASLSSGTAAPVPTAPAQDSPTASSPGDDHAKGEEKGQG